jgi:signal transduction histidine kinase
MGPQPEGSTGTAAQERAMESFAAIAAHDLKEPLRKAATFGRLLSQHLTDRDEKTELYLERMSAALAHMQRLVDSLLMLSSSAQVWEREPVDLTETARSAVSDLEQLVTETGATIVIGRLPTIEAEPTLMRQLFTNLLSNAIKFRQEDVDPIVRIEGVVTGENGDRWCLLTVADNGTGFSPEEAQRAFQPFERLVGRAQAEGSGLGLAICRRIVEAHGGGIDVTSNPGGGATFSIRLAIEAG